MNSCISGNNEQNVQLFLNYYSISLIKFVFFFASKQKEDVRKSLQMKDNLKTFTIEFYKKIIAIHILIIK